ncbi:MAG: hypothetical protein QOH84_6670, partial [Kribbellaceae bacterium]|nr:hypothetical protein [Kribbellaceae bacterium]
MVLAGREASRDPPLELASPLITAVRRCWRAAGCGPRMVLAASRQG